MSEKRPSLARQVAPAAILTAAGVAFVSLLDNPTGANKVALDGSGDAVAATTLASETNPATTTSPATTPAPEVATTLAPSPATTVLAPLQTTPASAQGRTDTTVAPTVPTVPPTAPTVPATAAPETTQPAASSGACDGDAVTSPTAMFRWGGIQLQVNFTKSNVICDVQVLQYPNDRSRSIAINTRALPVYNQEAVTANSASISALSGATDSWEAYTAALQAVIDSRP